MLSRLASSYVAACAVEIFRAANWWSFSSRRRCMEVWGHSGKSGILLP